MNMKKVLMTWVLLSVVGSGMAQQGSDNFPKEGSMFYMENGKTRTIKPSTRADGKVDGRSSRSSRIASTPARKAKKRG